MSFSNVGLTTDLPLANRMHCRAGLDFALRVHFSRRGPERVAAGKRFLAGAVHVPSPVFNRRMA